VHLIVKDKPNPILRHVFTVRAKIFSIRPFGLHSRILTCTVLRGTAFVCFSSFFSGYVC